MMEKSAVEAPTGSAANTESLRYSFPFTAARNSTTLRSSLRRRNSVTLGLTKDTVSFRIPTNADANAHVYEEHGVDTWRARVINFLHHRIVQCILCGLLVCDVIILFTELFLSAEFPLCSIIIRDAISCCMPKEIDSNSTGDQHLRWLTGDSNSHHDTGHDLCTAPLEDKPEYEATCDSHKYSGVHTTEHILYWITVGILSIFLIENITLMVAIGPKTFFRQIFYVFDLFLVTVSLALEISFYILDDETLAAYAGLLIFARFWRFVRIAHAIAEVTTELTSFQYNQKVMSLVEDLEILLTEYEENQNNGEKEETETMQQLRKKTHMLLSTIHEVEEEAHHIGIHHSESSKKDSPEK